jgi:hypothetical protein
MAFLISTRQRDKKDIKFEKFFIHLNSNEYKIICEDECFVLLEGFVYDLNLDKELSISEIKKVLLNSFQEPTILPNNLTGQYNIVFIYKEYISLLNDFVGSKPIYYSLKGEILISNSINSFIELGFQIDNTGFFQSMLPSLYVPLNCRTLLNDVYLLRNGESLLINQTTREKAYSIDSIDNSNKKIGNNDRDLIVRKLRENARIYRTLYKKLIFPISSGVDSRITLSSMGKMEDKNLMITYGEPDYIDNRIAAKICNDFSLTHWNVSFKNSLFPRVSELNDLIENGGEYFVGSWFSVIRELKRNNIDCKNSVVLLGDVLDILRAKNIKSIRSRFNRVLIQLKRIIGNDLKENNVDPQKFIDFQFNQVKQRLLALKKENIESFLLLNLDEKKFLEETYSDIRNFVEFVIKKVNPKSQYNLEESYFIFTWGARTMAKQTNIFKGSYESYVMMGNRHLVKFLLSYNPIDRFEDKLTHELLKRKDFNNYSKYPTSQIPFLSYSAPIFLKYLFWASRSIIDQITLRFGRGRMVKHIEWQKYYQSPQNRKQLIELLQDVHTDFQKHPIKTFDNRANGASWPLSEVDINTYVYLSKILSLVKR